MQAEARPGWPIPSASTSPRHYANTQARQFWQRAAWTRSANITNEEADERPVADSIGGQGSLEVVDFGALDAMETRKMEEERYAWFIEALGDLPGPARCRVPRLRGRRAAAGRGPRRRPSAVRAAPLGDPSARTADGLLPARSGRSRRSPAMPRGRPLAARREAGVGDARAVVRRSGVVLRGLPVRVVERLRRAGRRPRGRIAHFAPAGSRVRGSIRRHHATSWTARPPASGSTDRSCPFCSSQIRGCWTIWPATTRASRWPVAYPAPPSATGRPVKP